MLRKSLSTSTESVAWPSIALYTLPMDTKALLALETGRPPQTRPTHPSRWSKNSSCSTTAAGSLNSPRPRARGRDPNFLAPLPAQPRRAAPPAEGRDCARHHDRFAPGRARSSPRWQDAFLKLVRSASLLGRISGLRRIPFNARGPVTPPARPSNGSPKAATNPRRALSFSATASRSAS